MGGLSLNGHGVDGVDLRRVGRYQHRQIDGLGVQFVAGALLFQTTLETAVIAVVSGARHQQVVVAFRWLEAHPVNNQLAVIFFLCLV